MWPLLFGDHFSMGMLGENGSAPGVGAAQPLPTQAGSSSSGRARISSSAKRNVLSAVGGKSKEQIKGLDDLEESLEETLDELYEGSLQEGS